MKRVAVLLGMAVVAPSVAQAQIPIAPAPVATPPAPTPTPGAPAPATVPGPGPAPVAPPEAPPKAPPGDEYYVEPGPAAPTSPTAASERQPAPGEPPPFEPPPPGVSVFYEPPPPPQIRHLAPQTALWLGARLGWFFPFGNLWARAKPVSSSAGSGYVLQGVPWRDYASSGPMFELDIGARLSRSYTVFGLWERATLGSGENQSGPDGEQDGGESDFWAVGLRASSNADQLGFLTEVAVGYRRARTLFKSGVEYQFTDAPFEARLGLGAELRLNRMTSLSSLVTIGVGGFGNAQSVAPNGNAIPLTRSFDTGDGHAWATLTVGGHFDLISSAN
jgi:hypothetical protein